MAKLLTKDVLSGLGLLILGLTFVLAGMEYRLGSMRAMGPGFFPVMLGGVMMVLAAAILVQGLRSMEPVPRPAWRPFIAVVAGVALFSGAMMWFGLIPAVIVSVPVCALGDRKFSIRSTVLLPVTFHLEPTAALMMLAGVFYGGEYGGSTAAILLNLPGTASSAITCIDGHPMARKGRAGVALFTTTVASFVGANIGILLLVIFAPLLAEVALLFRPADYFAIMLLGVIAAATISGGSPAKGMAMVVLGLMLGCVGTDVNTGVQRYTLGFLQLFDGINIVALAMGLFGVSEVIASVNVANNTIGKTKITMRSMLPTRDEFRRSVFPMLRGSAVGSFFGALPGTGQTISSFMGYALEKRLSRHPEEFGKGAIEGIASPESANNASTQTAFIPTLTMGIPGSATMALMLGAMLIQGIIPGPGLVIDHPDVFWGLIASFWVGNVLLVILNIPLIGIWVKLLQVPYRLLYPAIICLICIGVYTINSSGFDVLLVLGFGIVGYAMRLMDYSPAPLLIGFILGPMMEENLRRALLLSRGDPMVFLTRPVSAGILAVTLLIVLWAIYTSVRARPKTTARAS